MAKKVKCIECENMMNWSLSFMKVDKENIGYAKQCLAAAKRTIVCGHTMKTKSRNNEQYCKYFKKSKFDNSNEEEIKNLEMMIKEYESQETGEAND